MPRADLAIFWTTAMLLLVGGAATATHVLPGEPQARLDLWRPDAAAREALDGLVQARLNRLPSVPTYGPLQERFMQYNRTVVFLDGEEYRQRLIRLQQELHRAASAFVEQHGWDAYLAVGTALAVRLEEPLGVVADGLEGARLPLQEWLRSRGEDSGVTLLRALSGRFLERAVNAGLLGYGVPFDGDSLRVARVLFLSHWTQLAGAGRNSPLSRPERVLLLAWKVEAATHLGLARRLELVAELSRLAPNYPDAFVRGILRLREGETDAARRDLLEAYRRGQESQRARRWLLQTRQAALALIDHQSR